MNEEQAKALRAPFPQEIIGKLPRVWCKSCRDAQFKVCDKHNRQKCDTCGNNITSAHLHLDYIGHAETTDRLLQVDPQWGWEPLAMGQDGLPALDRNGGLWIRLTVAGVTRLGYGHADGKQGADAVKESIGDALRNAAMRFGVALDLWGASGASQEDGPSDTAIGRGDAPQQQRQVTSKGGTGEGQRNGQQRNAGGPSPKELRNTVSGIAKAKGTTYEVLAGLYYKGTDRDLDHEQDAGRVQQFIDAIHEGRVQIPSGETAGASS